MALVADIPKMDAGGGTACDHLGHAEFPDMPSQDERSLEKGKVREKKKCQQVEASQDFQPFFPWGVIKVIQDVFVVCW